MRIALLEFAIDCFKFFTIILFTKFLLNLYGLHDGKVVSTARKTIFSFCKCFENMFFPKKLHWNMIFLVSSKKMIFPFPENLILFFRHKKKVAISQKNTWKYNIFFNCSEKMVFSRNSRLNRIFIVISGKMVFLFSRKYDIFCLDGKWKNTIVIKKRVELWYFLYTRVGITSIPLSSWQKNKDALAPKKYT